MPSETTENPGARSSESAAPPPNGSGRKVIGRPFVPGQSGNPLGRPRVEPRVRRYARKYDRRAVRELWRIGSDPKTPPDIARRTLMDLVAIGSGRPTLVQEVAGREGAPLVNVNLGARELTPEDLGPAGARGYEMVMKGELAAETYSRLLLRVPPARPPPIEAQPVNAPLPRACSQPQGVGLEDGQALGGSEAPAQPCAAAVEAPVEPPAPSPALCGKAHPQAGHLVCVLPAGHRGSCTAGGVSWSRL
jgi:hypothetical protein